MLQIIRATPGRRYAANLLPISITESEVCWARLGEDEQYNVILHRDGRREVVETVYSVDIQDWLCVPVVDPSSLDLKVYVP